MSAPPLVHAQPAGPPVGAPSAGSGWQLLLITGASLIASGLFALFLAATRQLLPHDIKYLGVVASQACGAGDGRILHFMFHDRAAFGGAVVATGLLYCWLAAGPLRRGQAWAWWTLALSGLVGFSSFLAYLGFGYFDVWHGVATVLLLPIFVLGLGGSFRRLRGSRHPRSLLEPTAAGPWATRVGMGRAALLFIAAGLVLAGCVIVVVGATQVFVPQDLQYLNLTTKELIVISPRLIPLIAHDRAGFGGALASCGLAMLPCIWCGLPTRRLWWALAVSGGVGFATAIGVHPLIGYNDFSHLAPAFAGLALFVAGLWLSHPTYAMAVGK